MPGLLRRGPGRPVPAPRLGQPVLGGRPRHRGVADGRRPGDLRIRLAPHRGPAAPARLRPGDQAAVARGPPARAARQRRRAAPSPRCCDLRTAAGVSCPVGHRRRRAPPTCMPDTSRALEAAAWAAAEGIATAEQRAVLEADPVAWRLMLERLMDETEDNLDSVSSIEGPERAQVVGDIEADLDRLEAAYDLLHRLHRHRRPRCSSPPPTPPARSGSRRRGRTARSSCGPAAPTWSPTRTPTSPTASRRSAARASAGPSTPTSPSRTACKAAALSIPVEEALGWLVVAVGGGQGDEDGVGASVRWLGRVAVAAVRPGGQGPHRARACAPSATPRARSWT